MPSVDVNINIRNTGARQAGDGFKQIGKEADTAAKLIDRVKGALAGLFAVFAAREIASLADEFQNVQNRLRLVATGTETLSETTQRLANIAKETRTNFALTAELYARVSIATRNLGVSSKETGRFVESVNKLIQSSGVNAREAEAGLIQFSQGLASNRLAGDELKSVLEGIPALGIAIARGLGVSFGELRRLGREQKLTADAVFRALQTQASIIDQEYAQLTVSVSKAFENVRTSLQTFLGQADESLNISRNLSRGLVFLSENFEIVGNSALIAAAGITAFAVAIAAPSLLSGSGAILALAAANPFAVLAGTVAGLTVAVIQLGDAVESFNGVSLADAFRGFGFGVLETAATALNASLQVLIGTAQVLGGAFLTVVGALGTAITGPLGVLGLVLRETEGALREVGEFLVGGWLGFIRIAGAGIDSLTEGFGRFGTAALSLAGSLASLPGRIAAIAQGFRDLRNSQPARLTPETEAFFAGRGGDAIASTREVIDGIKARIAAQTEAFSLSSREVRINKELAKIVKELDKQRIKDIGDYIPELREALELLEDQRDAFKGLQALATVDPLARARQERQEAEILLGQAFEANLITLAELDQALGRVEQRYRAAVDPIDDVVRGIENQIRVLQAGADSGSIRALIAAENEARKLGIQLTDEQIIKVVDLARQERELREGLKEEEQLRKRIAAQEKERERQRQRKIARGQKAIDEIDPLGAARRTFADDRSAIIARGRSQGLSAREIVDQVNELGEARKKSLRPLEFTIEALEKQVELGKLSTQEAKVEAEFQRISNDLKKAGIDLTDEQRQADAQRIRDLIRQGQAIDGQRERVKKLGEEIDRALVRSLEKATGQLAEFLISGERGALNFSNVLRGLATQLANIALQRLLFRPILSGLGIQGFRDGGIINRPTLFQNGGQLAVAGEAGREAILPLRRNNKGQLGVMAPGGGGGGMVSIGKIETNVTIEASGGAGGEDLEAAGQVAARETNLAVERAIESVIIRKSRPGAVLNQQVSV